MKLNSREKLLLILLSFIVVGAIYFYFYWIPMSAKLSDVKAQLAAQNAEIDSRTDQALTWAALQREVLKEQPTWDKLDLTIKESLNQSDIIKNISRITEPYASNVTMQFEAGQSDFTKIETLPVHVTLNAKYDDIVVMLKQFEQQDIDCKIVEMSMQELGLGTNHYSATFVLEYLQRAKTPQPQESK